MNALPKDLLDFDFGLQLFATRLAVDRAWETVDELERLDDLGDVDTYPILEDLERDLEQAICQVVKRVGPLHWRRLPGPKVIAVYDETQRLVKAAA